MTDPTAHWRTLLSRLLTWLCGPYRTEYDSWPHGETHTWPHDVAKNTKGESQ